MYVLILFLATSSSYHAGAAGITQEFSSYKTCEIAGKSLVVDAHEKMNTVLTWGCFPK